MFEMLGLERIEKLVHVQIDKEKRPVKAMYFMLKVKKIWTKVELKSWLSKIWLPKHYRHKMHKTACDGDCKNWLTSVCEKDLLCSKKLRRNLIHEQVEDATCLNANTTSRRIRKYPTHNDK